MLKFDKNISHDELHWAAQEVLALMQTEGSKILILQGEMGAGKTTFAKFFCQQLGVEGMVSSPTFSLINQYPAAGNQWIYHFDFYRIKEPQEALDAGLEMYLQSGDFCLIEWAENIADFLPAQFFLLRFSKTDDLFERNIKCFAYGHN